MKLIEVASNLDKYVVENWIEPLNVNLADVPFDSSSMDKWIRVRYSPSSSNLIGLDGNKGREELVGIYRVTAYARYRKTSLVVADDVKAMLDGLILNNIVKFVKF